MNHILRYFFLVIIILALLYSCKKKTTTDNQKTTSIDTIDYFTQLICKSYHGHTTDWASELTCGSSVIPQIDTTYTDSLQLSYICRDTILPAHHSLGSPENFKMYLLDSNYSSNRIEFFVCSPSGLAGGYKKLIYTISNDSIYYEQAGPPPGSCIATNPMFTPYIVSYYCRFYKGL